MIGCELAVPLGDHALQVLDQRPVRLSTHQQHPWEEPADSAVAADVVHIGMGAHRVAQAIGRHAHRLEVGPQRRFRVGGEPGVDEHRGGAADEHMKRIDAVADRSLDAKDARRDLHVPLSDLPGRSGRYP